MEVRDNPFLFERREPFASLQVGDVSACGVKDTGERNVLLANPGARRAFRFRGVP